MVILYIVFVGKVFINWEPSISYKNDLSIYVSKNPNITTIKLNDEISESLTMCASLLMTV